MQTFESERLQSEKRLIELETTHHETENKLVDIKDWIRLIKKHAKVKELNRMEIKNSFPYGFLRIHINSHHQAHYQKPLSTAH